MALISMLGLRFFSSAKVILTKLGYYIKIIIININMIYGILIGCIRTYFTYHISCLLLKQQLQEICYWKKFSSMVTCIRDSVLCCVTSIGNITRTLLSNNVVNNNKTYSFNVSFNYFNYLVNSVMIRLVGINEYQYIDQRHVFWGHSIEIGILFVI